MYELINFAADKLGRTIFFNPLLSMEEKLERATNCGDLMLNAFGETNEAFFLMLAWAFLGRMENDFCYRGGNDEQVIAIIDKSLYTAKKLEELRAQNESLDRAFDRFSGRNIFEHKLELCANATVGRRAELLNNPNYRAILDKYR